MGCASVKLDSKQNKQLSKQLEHSTKVGQVLNNLRKKPYEYIRQLEHDAKHFKRGKFLHYQYGCSDVDYETIQGPSAWQQAVKFLKAQYMSSHQLIRNSVLCEVAARRAPLYKQTKGKSTRSLPSGNIEAQLKTVIGHRPKSGDYAVLVGMDFKLKDRNYIQNAIVGLVIDDGNSSRSNRNLLFSDNFKYYGSFTMLTDDHVLVVVCLSSENLSSNL